MWHTGLRFMLFLVRVLLDGSAGAIGRFLGIVMETVDSTGVERGM